ncbi:MAG: transglycosylase SLT domain-containing protein [Betaproteobacteria bacterium]
MSDIAPHHSVFGRTSAVAFSFLPVIVLIAAVALMAIAARYPVGAKDFGDGLNLAATEPVVVAKPEAPEDRLSPRMQAALDYAARRYRVSSAALQPIFEAAQVNATELGLDPLLIVAVIAIESRFNPFAESEMGAQGLMQVIPRFHKEKLPADAGKLPFFDPVINVQVGAQALHEYIRRGGLNGGLQQFAGAADDPEQGYATKVLAEKERLEHAARRRSVQAI